MILRLLYIFTYLRLLSDVDNTFYIIVKILTSYQNIKLLRLKKLFYIRLNVFREIICLLKYIIVIKTSI